MKDNFKRSSDFKVLVKFLHMMYFKDKFKGTLEISSINGMSHHIKPRPSYGIEAAEKEVKGYDVNIGEYLK
jgi:hypothetical protein